MNTPQPTQGQLDKLAPAERWGYFLADRVHRHARSAAVAWNSTVMVGVMWLTCKRRIQAGGVENLQALDPERGVLLLSNHRTFFDFFIVTGVLFHETELQRHLLFPVRSEFFYDSPVGWGVNGLMSGLAMFPPIKRKRSGAVWNQYALSRCAFELQESAAVVGIHPEGKRHPELEHYQIGRLQSGAARVSMDAPNAQVVPVYISGFTNDLWREFVWNWTEPDKHPVGVHFGAALELGQQLADREPGEEPSVRSLRALTERFRHAIVEQAQACREMMEQAREKVRAA